MSQLTREEIRDIRNALVFFKGVVLGLDGMVIAATHHYNAAMDAVKKLENHDDEK